jgi:hypothetical protein
VSWQTQLRNDFDAFTVTSTKNIRKIKIQGLENIYKAFFYSLVAFLQHTFIYFSAVGMDRNALSEPGNEFFLFQRCRNLPPALSAMSSPRLEPHHSPKNFIGG